jgi:hypothetical protein
MTDGQNEGSIDRTGRWGKRNEDARCSVLAGHVVTSMKIHYIRSLERIERGIEKVGSYRNEVNRPSLFATIFDVIMNNCRKVSPRDVDSHHDDQAKNP